jgi:hypothetical protein
MYGIRVSEQTYMNRDTVGQSTIHVLDSSGRRSELVLVRIEQNGSEVVREYEDRNHVMMQSAPFNYSQRTPFTYEYDDIRAREQARRDAERRAARFEPRYLVDPKFTLTSLKVKLLEEPPAVISV